MTKAQAQDLAKGWGATITSAVALLTSLGFVVLSPKDQLSHVVETQSKVNVVIERRLDAQGRQLDSIREALQKVDALVRVKCVETKDKLARNILDCDR